MTIDQKEAISCEVCDKKVKNAAGLAAHARIKHAAVNGVTPTAAMDAADAVVAAGPQKREPLDLGRPSFHKAHSNIRSMKFLVPLCVNDPETGFQGCQDKPGAINTLWWKTCSHDPYYSMKRRTEKRANLTEVEPGRFLREGEKEYVWYEEEPNTEQVQVSPRVHGTLYGIDPVTWRLANGRIRPMDHPTKPVKDFCEYHNCWSQKIAVRDSEIGNYCSATAAKRVKLDIKGKAIEALNMEKLEEQLDAVKVG